MSATASLPDCKEMTVQLPGNEQALCWFDAANFALFHKRRPELDEYFKTHTTSADKLIQQLYDHYSGQNKDITNIKNFQETFRKNIELINFFKKTSKKASNDVNPLYTIKIKKDLEQKPESYTYKDGSNEIIVKDGLDTITIPYLSSVNTARTYELSKDVEGKYILKLKTEKVIGSDIKDGYYTFNFTEGEFNTNFTIYKPGSEIEFSIDNDTGGDSSEYLNKYLDFMFETSYTKVTQNVEGKANSYISANHPLLDILFGTKPYDLSTSTSSEEYTFQKIGEQCYTYFIQPIDKGNKNMNNLKPINYQESIKVPLYKNTSTDTNKIVLEKSSEGIFKLDALVVHTGIYHFYSVARCGDSDDWITYDDTDLSVRGIGNASIKDLMETKKDYIILKGFEAMRNNNKNNTNVEILIYSRKKE